MASTVSRRLLPIPIAGALALAACGSDDGGGADEADAPAVSAETGSVADDSSDDPGVGSGEEFDEIAADDPSLETVSYGDSAAVEVEVEATESGPREDVVSGLDTFRDPDPALPEPTIDLSVLRSGGPPPDGIPAIDEPRFHRADSVDYLAPSDPVVALEIDGDARAYPLDIMIWHELVNDTVGGVPVSVAYCPLCNSVTVYEREIGDRVLDFGVSGLLYNSSLVMYDRQTETLWSHFTGEPLYGALGEADLVAIPATITGFGSFVDEHPDGLVLTRDTGADRDYGVNPYPGYDSIDNDPFLFEGEVDGRFTAMTRVVGVESADGSAAAAFPLLELREAGVETASLGEGTAVAFWAPGATSALDGGQVSGGVDVGTTGVFVPEIDGRRLTLRPDPAAEGTIVAVDDETGSRWNVFGEAVDGELAGAELEQLAHIDTFWFAWIAFHPDSAVV